MDPIYFFSKSKSYSELSNFYHSPFKVDGVLWDTVEHYFQAMKFPSNPEYQEVIRLESSPAYAKKLGSTRGIKMRSDWDLVKDSVMERALYEKFSQNGELKELLLSTDSSHLIENNKWDNYWGIGNGSGLNKLGNALCKLRERLKSTM
jgi:ribA/ribD-fused uncharacterized protein